MAAPAVVGRTNFSALQSEQLAVWSRDFWKLARNLSFINQFAGKGSNAMVQRITELTKSKKGARAFITLINDMTGDGIGGDFTLEGNEEELTSDDCEIKIDQLRNANRIKGRLADQKSVVNFRENSRDQLAYWLADRMDQLAFLTLAGESYGQTNKGATRASEAATASSGFKLSELEFASGVTAPSTNRHLRWDATTGLNAGNTASVESADTLSYKALVELKAYAKDEYIRGIKGPGGKEIYHVFVTPQGMAKLKLDSDFLANVRNAGVRGASNSLFAGTDSVMVDGLMVHEFRHVYNNVNAGAGNLWGSGSDVKGQATMLCGAQALAMADIGNPEWVEDSFDYGNQHGISISKMFGFKKPVFNSEDHAVIRLDTAI